MNVDLRASTRRMITRSPASAEVCAFKDWLKAEHYTDYTIDCHLRRLIFVLPRLLCGTQLRTLCEADLVGAFGRERQPLSRFHVFAGTRRAFTRFLRSQGRLVAPAEQPADGLVRRYEVYLIEVRGLSASARRHHTRTLRALLAQLAGSGRRLRTLSRDDLEEFVRGRACTVSRHSLQHEVAHVRAFLRYAHDQGLVAARFDGLDTPRTYRGELPPKALPWPTVLRLLRSIDRSSRAGWRDLVMLHLMAYYGLRPCEVVALRLDSIDWAERLLHVFQSKTRARLTLPLAPSTVRLLRDYLRIGRAGRASATPMLFLRMRCPHIPLERTAVADIFEKRTREAGIPDCGKHVYRLRHTFAMRLLSRGVGMKAIGDVLGHRSFYGTSAYLRLDVAMLRGVALDVPAQVGGAHA